MPDQRRRRTARGVSFELRRGARLLQRRQPRGQLLGQVHLDPRDVRLRTRLVAPNARSDRDTSRQARTIRFAGLTRRGDLEVRLELQARHEPTWKRTGDRSARIGRPPRLAAASTPYPRTMRTAIRRVEHEAGTIDHRIDTTQIRRDARDDLRQRIRRDRRSARYEDRLRSSHASRSYPDRTGPRSPASRSTGRTAHPHTVPSDRSGTPGRPAEGSPAGRDRDRHGDRVADLRGGRDTSLRGLRFAAQRDGRDHPRQALGRLELQPFDALLPIAALQQQREVRIATRLIGRRARDQRWRERQR